MASQYKVYPISLLGCIVASDDKSARKQLLEFLSLEYSPNYPLKGFVPSITDGRKSFADSATYAFVYSDEDSIDEAVIHHLEDLDLFQDDDFLNEVCKRVTDINYFENEIKQALVKHSNFPKVEEYELSLRALVYWIDEIAEKMNNEEISPTIDLNEFDHQSIYLLQRYPLLKKAIHRAKARQHLDGNSH